MLLEGRVALVSGIGPGMGREISLALANQGADVALIGRSDRHMPALAGEIEALGRRAWTIRANIADPDACATAAQVVQDTIGAIDVLVNNAFHSGDIVAFEDADLSRWRRPMEVNHFGTLQLTQALLPALKAAAAVQDDARIVMINTMSMQLLAENHGAYTGSKAALAAVTKTLARELGRHKIRVNSVHPGYIMGDNIRYYFQLQADERADGTTWQDLYDERAAETALGYLPHSAEIAGAVVFYASPLARCVTGTSLAVNAGHWIGPAS